MSNEHNPIAQLISQIQHKWISDITPYSHLKLARWLIIPEQARLYEGFLKMESSAQGSLPDMTLVLLVAFQNKETHSENLIKDWIYAYRGNQKLIEDYALEHTDFIWDVDSFEKKLNDKSSDNNLLLIEMLRSFQEALPDKKRPFTLCLFPYSIEDTKEYEKWLDSLIKLELPDKVRFMIFDYADERYFDGLIKTHSELSKSLSVPLDLNGAISKIASSGDPNKPEVQFRQCMMKMFKYVKSNDLTQLNIWGNKGLEAAQRSGLKSFYASAHLTYAGMLFSFKEYEDIDALLQKGLALAKQGVQTGDDSCKSILVQIYAFQASSKQLQNKKEEATALFCKQADTALEYGFVQQPLTAWWMAYNIIKNKDKGQYKELVVKAYDYGNKQEKETLKSTCMTFIAADYYNILDQQNQNEDCKKIDEFMAEIEGIAWRDHVETRKKEMEKRKLSLRNWF